MILFVGDSITHGTDWSKQVSFTDTQNIAVPGYLTDDVMNQLQQIAEIKPKVISLCIGTNDMGNESLLRSGEDVGQRVTTIIGELVNQNVNTHVVVNSILPRSEAFTEKIRVANKIISAFTHQRVTYLDCWPTLSLNNYLRPEYLLEDGFDAHLSDEGFQAWGSILIPLLEKLHSKN